MSSKNETGAERNARRRRQREALRRRIAELEGPHAGPRVVAAPAPASLNRAYAAPRRVLVCGECGEEFPVTSAKPRIPICPACLNTT